MYASEGPFSDSKLDWCMNGDKGCKISSSEGLHKTRYQKPLLCLVNLFLIKLVRILVAHDCGYPLSRYTCRATRVAADFLDFIAFCRCSTGVALHPLKILVSHLPPPVPGGVAPKVGSEKVSRYTGVSQLQLRVSRYTAQLRWGFLAFPLFSQRAQCFLSTLWQNVLKLLRSPGKERGKPRNPH